MFLKFIMITDLMGETKKSTEPWFSVDPTPDCDESNAGVSAKAYGRNWLISSSLEGDSVHGFTTLLISG